MSESEHRWENQGIVNRGAQCPEDKYCVFRCTGCGQELWHYYDISLSPRHAAELEQIPRQCRAGQTVMLKHRQVELYIQQKGAPTRASVFR